MHKFNVGDRVVYICKDPDAHDRHRKLHAGMTGTISRDNSDDCVCVSFDNYTLGVGKKKNSTHVYTKDVIPYVPNFKVGDRVELLCEPRDNLIRNGLKVGFTGTVKRISNDNYVTVTWDNWHSGWSYEHGTKKIFNGSCYNVASNIIKLNRPKFKFNVGDTVKSNDNFSKDLIGKIINISKFLDRTVYLVEFNETSDNFHDGDVELNELIKGSKTGKDNHCYYLHENNIEKWNGKCNKIESMIIA